MTFAQGDKSFTTLTDSDGHYAYSELGPGTWTVSIDMFGFQSFKQDVDYGSATGPVNFTLQLKESQMARRLQQFAERRSAGGTAGGMVDPTGPGTRRRQDSTTQQADSEIRPDANQGTSRI